MKYFYLGLGAALGMALALAQPVFGQNSQTSTQRETFIGTAVDVNGDPISNAAVVLKEVDGHDAFTIVTSDNGLFEFHEGRSAVPYQLSVSAKGFADWMSQPIILNPGQFRIATGIRLRIEIERTTVDGHYDPVEVATEQFKAEERQCVFGFIPNFYVSYEGDPAPLTAKMKFKLAFKLSTDPVTARFLTCENRCKVG